MNREQAIAWMEQNKKEPYFSGPYSPHPGKYGWAVEQNQTDQIPHPICQHLKGIDSGYDSKSEAKEDLIQAVMKTYPDEPEVDVKSIGKVYLMQARLAMINSDQEEKDIICRYMMQAFIAGFDAGRKQG